MLRISETCITAHVKRTITSLMDHIGYSKNRRLSGTEFRAGKNVEHRNGDRIDKKRNMTSPTKSLQWRSHGALPDGAVFKQAVLLIRRSQGTLPGGMWS
ncbi:hypothetical protein MAR_035802 [Mya arenaria]|uniref:Transposase n=1 Tax=Mya arenaria TaxID=6604 RepID=A0ABY7EPJ1_MYAAR|nr:hypothetical protein MAR_035802 [Mya arenaria]